MNLEICKNCKYYFNVLGIDVLITNIKLQTGYPCICILNACLASIDKESRNIYIEIKNKILKSELRNIFNKYPYIIFDLRDNKFYQFDIKKEIKIDNELVDIIYKSIYDLEVDKNCPFYVEHELEKLNNERNNVLCKK